MKKERNFTVVSSGKKHPPIYENFISALNKCRHKSDHDSNKEYIVYELVEKARFYEGQLINETGILPSDLLEE